MLNDQDIDKLVTVLASKKDVEEIKTELGHLRELVQSVVVSSDSIAKSIGELKLEYAAISVQLSRHDNWIKQIAEKIGLTLSDA